MGLMIAAKDKLAFILISLAFRIQLDVIYTTYIVDKCNYQSFFLDVNFYKLAFSHITLAFFIALLKYRDETRFSHLMV